MTFGSNNNYGGVRQLNLNEMYNKIMSSQHSIRLHQQTSGLEP